LLFDTRGKRKHVIRVVYAILALLMGASLFLVVGPVNIGALLGNSNSTSSAAAVLDEQAERIERRLAKSPNDAQLLLSLTRVQIAAGNAQLEVGSETEVPTVTPGALENFEQASQSWNRYLKQAGGEPSASAAQLVAGTFFRLAETGSFGLSEIESNVAKAVTAQRIAAEQQPSIGSLSTLGIYEYFDGNFAAGDKATKRAAALAPAKAEAKNIEKQLAEYHKRAEQFQQQAKQIAKQQQKASKEQLQNPFNGLGPPGGSPGE
jgi:Skp family chaperone for outer membrane proteins